MTVRTNRKGSATLRTVSDTAYEIERKFDAKADSVFRAMTEPQYVRRWWGFPDVEWLDCQIDLRVGGYWRFAVRGEGYEVAFHGHYQRLDRPHNMAHTEIFEGMPGGGPDVHEPKTLITTRLIEQDGLTTLHAHVECYSPEVLNGILESGMESGLQVSYDRIEDLVPEIEG